MIRKCVKTIQAEVFSWQNFFSADNEGIFFLVICPKKENECKFSDAILKGQQETVCQFAIQFFAFLCLYILRVFGLLFSQCIYTTHGDVVGSMFEVDFVVASSRVSTVQWVLSVVFHLDGR